jgi:formamidopyrimidine-DNA glycosylase
MPELPEVEHARRVLDRYLVGRSLLGIATAPDDIVYEGVTPRRFGAALRGRRVMAARRKGKHLWLELDRRPWPTFHFGMGGDFHVYRTPHERPRFWKLELLTDRGVRLAMTNPRRLGRIRLVPEPILSPPFRRLGPDPYLDLPPSEVLTGWLARRPGPIKAVLLDQGFLAGVGNWIADEVLFQARLDPRRPGRSLTPTEVRRFRRCLARILAKAVAVDADAERFPRGWLFHRRWGRDPSARTAAGERIVFDTIGGRTTAWVPTVQG